MVPKTNLYQDIVDLVDELADQELIDLEKYIKVMIRSREHAAQYVPTKDPILTGEGLFDGPGDLSDRTEEILYGDERHSVYDTNKPDGSH